MLCLVPSTLFTVWKTKGALPLVLLSPTPNLPYSLLCSDWHFCTDLEYLTRKKKKLFWNFNIYIYTHPIDLFLYLCKKHCDTNAILHTALYIVLHICVLHIFKRFIFYLFIFKCWKATTSRRDNWHSSSWSCLCTIILEYFERHTSSNLKLPSLRSTTWSAAAVGKLCRLLYTGFDKRRKKVWDLTRGAVG